jgi:hypothetical protein
MAAPRVFQPDPEKLRRELAIGAVVYVIAAPILYAWRSPGLPGTWLAVAFVAGLVALVGVPLYRAVVRGFDTIGIGDEAIVVFRRHDPFRLEWTRVGRVYRFRDQLIVETTAPVRRLTVHLVGHEHHAGELFTAMRKRASALDLAALDSIARLGLR